MGIDQSRLGSEDILRVWDVGTGKELFKVDGSIGDVSPIAFSTDGAEIACGTSRKGVVLLKTTTGKKLLTLPTEEEHAAFLAFSPDGKLLSAGTYKSGTILIWRLNR